MDGFGAALGRAFEIMLVCCVIFVPLGLWKLVEIVLWLWRHISWVS